MAVVTSSELIRVTIADLITKGCTGFNVAAVLENDGHSVKLRFTSAHNASRSLVTGVQFKSTVTLLEHIELVESIILDLIPPEEPIIASFSTIPAPSTDWRNDLLPEIRNLLSYNPNTGMLLWKRDAGKSGRGRMGDRAGTLTQSGSYQVSIMGHRFMAHVLAWALHYDKFPESMPRHKDGNKARNYIKNLYLSGSKK